MTKKCKKRRQQMQQRKPDPLDDDEITIGLDLMVTIGLFERMTIDGVPHWRPTQFNLDIEPNLAVLPPAEVEGLFSLVHLLISNGATPAEAWAVFLTEVEPGV